MTPRDHATFSDPDLSPSERSRDPGDDRRRRRLLGRILFGVVLVLTTVIGIGVFRHYTTHEAAVAAVAARQHLVPEVRVQTVKAITEPRALGLPGTTLAFESATIYARASGYIGQRQVDIGSRVKAGDLLALITAPEIDDQLAQARAQLAQTTASLDQAQANAQFAQATNRRTSKLVTQGWQTQQQGDQDRTNLAAQQAAVEVAQANLKAMQAQVARLEKQQSYERVTAPFDGVITARNIDVGSLVTADSTSGTSLFAIARTNVLRVQVFVPQDSALGIRDGVAADVTVPELPGRTFSGKVSRTADALQSDTRTLLVQVDIDNGEGTLTAGLYCTVRFAVPRPRPAIVIPAEALVFTREGLQVATFDDGIAHLHKVQIGQDDGAQVEIAAGLEPGNRIIVRPPVDLAEGAPVRAAPEPPAPPPATAGR